MRFQFQLGSRRLRYLAGGAILLLLVCLAGGLSLRAHRSEGDSDDEDQTTAAQSGEATHPRRAREVNAAWYEVPKDSLARRRAGPEEMTAAHNKLPFGTMVRVTRLQNGKSVLVRITDRGITDRRVKLDLCKEAATELEMVSEGVARVRMEVVSEANGASPPEMRSPAPSPP
ncbi:MAG: septal ring lytic transglycosylase RlpA family protein [Chthoniobacterales bacterium]